MVSPGHSVSDFLLDLNRMFKLLSRIRDEGILPMLEILQNYVKTTGNDAIMRLSPEARVCRPF
jgi:hypothetical protein